MRKHCYITICLIIIFTLSYIGQVQAETISVSAENAVLIEQSSGRILFEKNAHEKKSVASITKIMTAIIAIEQGELDDMAITSRDAIYTEGSSIYLEQGEKMSIEDLLYGLMLRSGNDAAVVLSEHIGGSEEGFVYLMNEKARWLGMKNTNFENPHGLESPNHYSTAYDMAILMRYAMNNDAFQEISNTKIHKAKTRSYAWKNKNRLLNYLYDYCTGGKTGFTKKAGRTLVTTATRGHSNLIAVTLNAPNDWTDHIQMFEYGFKNYHLTKLQKEGKESYKTDELNKIIGFHNEMIFPLTKSELDGLQIKSYLLKDTNNKDDVIGKKVFYVSGVPIAESPIFTTEYYLEQKSVVEQTIILVKRIIGMYENG